MNLNIIYARLESRKKVMKTFPCSESNNGVGYNSGYMSALKDEIDWLESQIPQYYYNDLYAKSQGWAGKRNYSKKNMRVEKIGDNWKRRTNILTGLTSVGYPIFTHTTEVFSTLAEALTESQSVSS